MVKKVKLRDILGKARLSRSEFAFSNEILFVTAYLSHFDGPLHFKGGCRDLEPGILSGAQLEHPSFDQMENEVQEDEDYSEEEDGDDENYEQSTEWRDLKFPVN